MPANSELQSGDIYKSSNRISLNFADVPDEFVTIPEGVYPAVVSKCEEAMSQPKPNKPSAPMLVWEYTVDTPEYWNVNVRDWTSLQQQALWKLKGVLKAIGVEIAEDGSCDFEPEELVGLPCQIKIKHTRQEKKDKQTGGTVVGTDGKPEMVTFANIDAVLPPAEGQAPSGLV